MRRDLRDLKSVLKRVEERIGKEQGPSEFSPVTIRIQSEDGRPLEGFLVKMESARKEVRRVSASSRSDREGLALSRHLPYGEYRLSVKHESGWSTTFRDITIEVGEALEKVVIAPDPQERASVKIQSALRPDAFEGLRFGERREPRGARAYSIEHSPEPGEDRARFASFPTVGDGISEAGVEVRIGIEREIQQPGGESQKWRWSGGENAVHRLLVTPDGAAAITNVESKSARPEDSSRYFAPADGQSEFYTVGFLKLELQNPIEQGVSLELAPGDATLLIAEPLGKAKPEALSSLGVDEGSEVWLQASLSGESEWVPRIIDLEGWERGTGISHLAKKTLELEAGEHVEVTIGSPRWSWWHAPTGERR